MSNIGCAVPPAILAVPSVGIPYTISHPSNQSKYCINIHNIIYYSNLFL